MQIYYHAYVKEWDNEYGFDIYRVTFKTASEDGYETIGYLEVAGLDYAEKIAQLFRENGETVLSILDNFVAA